MACVLRVGTPSSSTLTRHVTVRPAIPSHPACSSVSSFCDKCDAEGNAVVCTSCAPPYGVSHGVCRRCDVQIGGRCLGLVSFSHTQNATRQSVKSVSLMEDVRCALPDTS